MWSLPLVSWIEFILRPEKKSPNKRKEEGLEISSCSQEVFVFLLVWDPHYEKCHIFLLQICW